MKTRPSSVSSTTAGGVGFSWVRGEVLAVIFLVDEGSTLCKHSSNIILMEKGIYANTGI